MTLLILQKTYDWIKATSVNILGHKNSGDKKAPTVILHNITVASRVWFINNMNLQITASNISKSYFWITPLELNSNLSVNINKTMIGLLDLNYVMANISQSQVFKLDMNKKRKAVVTAYYASLKLHKVIFNMISLKMSQSILYGEQSRIEITHCRFTKNALINKYSEHNEYGGNNGHVELQCIFIKSQSELLVYDTFFIENAMRGTLIGVKSTASFMRCNFTSNQAPFGGAILAAANSHIYVSKSSFTGNYACYGGGIVVFADSSLKVDNSFFYNNNAVSPSEITKAYFVTCNFTSNEASSGGAIFGKYNSHIYVSKSSFAGNYACFGGGIKVIINSSVKVENSTFYENSATGPSAITTSSEGQYKLVLNGTAKPNKQWPYLEKLCRGGAVYIEGFSYGEISNCLFDANMALLGGSISLQQSNLIIQGGQFKGNAAGESGALIISGDSNIHIEHSSFIENKSILKYGAIGAVNSSLKIYNSRFSRNSARLAGGALGIYDNTTMSMKSCRFQENGAQEGGVIDVKAFCKIDIENCTLHENFATGTSAIRLADRCTINMHNSNIVNNKVTGTTEGTVTVAQGSTGNISYVSFINNTSSDTGNIIYLNEACSLIFHQTKWRLWYWVPQILRNVSIKEKTD